MSRRPRVTGEGVCHHVYAWGNDRHPVFKAENHFKKYLRYLAVYSARFRVDVICYALMSWHLHLSLFDRVGNLPQFMKCLHGRYARYYNGVTNRVGHVFGERYNNRIVKTAEDALWLSRYIHRQAVDAGIVKHPRDYRWTSYQAYIGLVPVGFLKPRFVLGQFGFGAPVFRLYEDFVMSEDDGPVDWSQFSAPVTDDEEPGDEITGRREAFCILVRDYGLSASRVSSIFSVTPRTVGKAVWS
jgi:REP element-mobilizing transposase RayT